MYFLLPWALFQVYKNKQNFHFLSKFFFFVIFINFCEISYSEKFLQARELHAMYLFANLQHIPLIYHCQKHLV